MPEASEVCMAVRHLHHGKPVPTLKPKNGRYPIILVAGGPSDRAKELREFFAERRASLIKYHWNYEKSHDWVGKEIPKDVDLVIGLKSMMGHSVGEHLKAAVKKADVLCIMTSHKWSVLDNALRQRVTIPVGKLPLEVKTTAYLREVEDKPLPTVVVPPPPVLAIAPPPPAPTPPPAPVAIEDAELHAARLEYAKKDTMVLIHELQVRLATSGFSDVLVELTQVTFQSKTKP